MKRSDSSCQRRRSVLHHGDGRRRFLALATILLAGSTLGVHASGHDGAASAPPSPMTVTPAPPAGETVKPAADQAAIELPAPAEILARYVDAIGGRDAWLAEHSRTVTLRIEIKSPTSTQGMANESVGTMIVQQKAPDRMASTMELEGLGAFKQGFDGERAWSIGPDGQVRELKGGDLAERRREAYFDRELRLGSLYDRVETVAQRDFQGEPCWLLRFSSDDGAAAQAWFSVNSGLMHAMVRRLTAPGGTLSVLQTYSDYQNVGARRFPGRIVQTVGHTTQTMILESVDDTCLDDEIFKAPAELMSTPTTPTTPPQTPAQTAPSMPSSPPPSE